MKTEIEIIERIDFLRQKSRGAWRKYCEENNPIFLHAWDGFNRARKELDWVME